MRRAFIASLLFLAIAISVLPATAGASYKGDLKSVTKRTAIYDLTTGDASIIFRAIFFTDAFRSTFAEKSAEINHLGPVEAAAYIAEQQQAQARGWEIFLGMYTRRKYEEFSLARNTFWKAILTTSMGESVAPISIEKIKLKPYWRVIFPNLTHWDVGYRVVFPKVPLGAWAAFTMQSVLGEAQVSWKFKK